MNIALSRFTASCMLFNDEVAKQMHVSWHYTLFGSAFSMKKFEKPIWFSSFWVKSYFLYYEVPKNLSRGYSLYKITETKLVRSQIFGRR